MRPVPRTAAAGAARGRSEQLDVTTLSASAALAVPGPGLTASLSGRLTGPGSASDPLHDGCLGVRPRRPPHWHRAPTVPVSAVAAGHCQRRRAALQPACRWH